MPATTANATLTGRTGIGSLISSLAVTNLALLEIDFVRGVTIIHTVDNRRIELDFVLTTTFTDSIAALVNTIVMSGS